MRTKDERVTVRGIILGSFSSASLYLLPQPPQFSLCSVSIPRHSPAKELMSGSFSQFPGSWQREDTYNKPVRLRNCCRCFFLLFCFTLIYFNSNQKVTGMHLVCAKPWTWVTKMGRTKSWPRGAQKVVRQWQGVRKQPMTGWWVWCGAEEEEEQRKGRL